MTEKLEIQEVICRYALGVSQAKWDVVAGTFCTDASWELPALNSRAVGLEQIIATIKQFAEPMKFLAQLSSPSVIRMDGDRASARTLMRECAGYPDKDVALEVLGVYDDDLVRTDAGWRFMKRVFTVISLHEYAITPVPTA